MKLNKMISMAPRRGGDYSLIWAIALAMMAAGTNVHADTVLAEYTFESGAEGWTGFACPGVGICPGVPIGPPEFEHLATGGSDLGPSPDGGNLRGIDPGELIAGTTFAAMGKAPGSLAPLLAPDLWLSFDLKINGSPFDNDDPGPFENLVPFFYISGAGGLIAYAVDESVALPATGVPMGTWTSFEIPLVSNDEQGAAGGPGLWYNTGGVASTTDFNDALGDATEMFFWLELTKDPVNLDGVQLDNVKLVMHMIPIPAALPLMLCALAGLGFAGRRRV